LCDKQAEIGLSLPCHKGNPQKVAADGLGHDFLYWVISRTTWQLAFRPCGKSICQWVKVSSVA